MSRERKSIEAGLKNKGFRQKEGDHHYLIYYSEDGRKSLSKTKTSHSPKMKTLSNDLLSKMSQQCYLTKAEFLDLIDCPLSRSDYEMTCHPKSGPLDRLESR